MWVKLMRIGALSRLVVAFGTRAHGRRTGHPGFDAAFVRAFLQFGADACRGGDLG